jgi:hypothetical protein
MTHIVLLPGYGDRVVQLATMSGRHVGQLGLVQIG